MAHTGDRRDTGQRAEPCRPRERPADMDAADVVHLRDAPSNPQRPRARATPGESEERVEDVLLADEDSRGEVDQRERPERGQGAAVVDQPVAAVEVVPEQHGVDQHDREDQPVVGHEPRVLGQAPGGGREAARARCRGRRRRGRVRTRERGPSGRPPGPGASTLLLDEEPHAFDDARPSSSFPQRARGASHAGRGAAQRPGIRCENSAWPEAVAHTAIARSGRSATRASKA
jgi:hypothetical protein